MPKMRIVILSAFLSPFRSGAEAMVEEVAVRLSKKYDITIVTGRYAKKLPREGVLDGSDVRVIRVGFGIKADKYLFPFLSAVEVLMIKPKIVHAVLESYAGLGLVCCKWLYPNAKRILTLQSTNTTFLLAAIHRAADSITAISRVLQERGKKFGRRDIHLIPNGISLEAIHEAEQFHTRVPGRILFVGRLEKMKGVDTLLHAFHLLLTSHDHHPFNRTDLHLRIVGGGSQQEKLKELARHLQIQDKVLFLGRIAPAAIYDEYAQAELFCGLSRREALGNVFLEAQGSGCPVVATKVDGIPEIVHHEVTGLLVPSNDPKAAADAIVRILSDHDLYEELSVGGRNKAERYDWSRIVEDYARIYV